jgi:hypothetical protein
MKVFVTGDTQGETEVEKLGNSAWKEQGHLGPDDLLIVLGNFGFVRTEPDETEQYWLEWFSKKPYQIAFVDGNHENHSRLRALPTATFCGGQAGRVSLNVWHLRRGEVFTLDGPLVFVMGGASSIDRKYRREGGSWWPDEVPTQTDVENIAT